MTLHIDENIILEPTSQEFATQLFNVINNSRQHLSEFLPWVGDIQNVENTRQYLRNCEILQNEKKEVSFIILTLNYGFFETY